MTFLRRRWTAPLSAVVIFLCFLVYGPEGSAEVKSGNSRLMIGGKRVWIGGFHDHWSRTLANNPALLMAAMNYYHYDFICLMDGNPTDAWMKKTAEKLWPGVRLYLGKEFDLGWAHVITLQPRFNHLPLDLDPRSILSKLASESLFAAFAHPMIPMSRQMFLSGRIDDLLEQGVIPAVQLEMTPEEKDWFRKRDAAGKLTPLVGGWDVHFLKPVRNLPKVLYDRSRTPVGHLDTGGSNRTLVIAEDNSLQSLVAAVLHGNSVVEVLGTGELIGPSALVRFLEENGYRHAIKALDERRDQSVLSIDRTPVSGEPLRLHFSNPGSVTVPVTFDEPATYTAYKDRVVVIDRAPALLDRDITYLPVVKTDADGYTRAWAVELHHPIQLDVLPKFQKGLASLEIKPKAPFKGAYSIQIEVEGGSTKLIHGDGNKLVVRYPATEPPSLPVTCQLTATSDKGLTRRLETLVTYARVLPFQDDWAKAHKIGMDKARYSASSRPWSGPDVFSGQMQFAWTREKFLARFEVTDKTHYQPRSGQFTYTADCIEIGIDPFLKREDIPGAIYTFTLALTPEGPEIYRILAPAEGAIDGLIPPKEKVSLGGKYLAVEKKENGLLYTLALPWSEIAFLQPADGTRMGIFVAMHNNNGEERLHSLFWPAPIAGMWWVPNRWGVLTLLEDKNYLGKG